MPDGLWNEAFYDSEDDEWFTWRCLDADSTGADARIEMLSLSPLCDAPARFDDRPELHKIIFDAVGLNGRRMEAQESPMVDVMVDVVAGLL